MSIKSLFVIAGAMALLLTSCASQQDTLPPQAAAIPVIATSPEVKDITVYMDSIGTLQPSVYMEIRPQTSGALTEVLVAEGQLVQRGTPLFVIDPKPYAIKVQEMEALLAIEHANLRAVNKKLERFRDLAQKDLIAETEWDELEAQHEKCQATIELNQARLETAKLDLEHCTLRSPIDGRIGKLDAHPGHLVASGQAAPLVTISKMDPLIIEFTVTEKEFQKLPRETLQVQMHSLCAKDSCQEGTVTFLDNQFDTKTGLLLIRGEAKNADGLLRPGQSVKVQVPVSVTPGAKLIPQKAIRYNQDGPYVYVVNDDMTVANRQIILGIEQGDSQIVLQGLDPTERIILDGHLRLSPGLKVEIKS
jgi:multidrug efflux system membrane fusion protein